VTFRQARRRHDAGMRARCRAPLPNTRLTLALSTSRRVKSCILATGGGAHQPAAWACRSLRRFFADSFTGAVAAATRVRLNADERISSPSSSLSAAACRTKTACVRGAAQATTQRSHAPAQARQPVQVCRRDLCRSPSLRQRERAPRKRRRVRRGRPPPPLPHPPPASLRGSTQVAAASSAPAGPSARLRGRATGTSRPDRAWRRHAG